MGNTCATCCGQTDKNEVQTLGLGASGGMKASGGGDVQYKKQAASAKQNSANQQIKSGGGGAVYEQQYEESGAGVDMFTSGAQMEINNENYNNQNVIVSPSFNQLFS